MFYNANDKGTMTRGRGFCHNGVTEPPSPCHTIHAVGNTIRAVNGFVD